MHLLRKQVFFFFADVCHGIRQRQVCAAFPQFQDSACHVGRVFLHLPALLEGWTHILLWTAFHTRGGGGAGARGRGPTAWQTGDGRQRDYQ